MPQHFGLFLLGSIVITMVPGADMALITRQVVTRGRGAAQATIFGNLTGILVHAFALAIGLSALLVASATAYTAVKLAGACYLIYLGVQSFREARRSTSDDERDGGPQGRRYSGNPYTQGLLSTVLNPKPALFFLSYVPQFIDPDGSVAFQVSLLAAVHIAVGFVWLTTFAWLVSRMHAVIVRPRVKAALERITGALLVAIGLSVALEKR